MTKYPMTNVARFQFSVIQFCGGQIQHSAFKLQCCWVFGAWSLLFVCAVGCQRGSDVPVEGSVTFDGKPVEMGAISFVPTERGLHSQGATIADGKFATMLRPGHKRVEIRASRALPPDPQHPNLPSGREDFIPAKFNSASTLTAEIVAGDENQLQFELQSK